MNFDIDRYLDNVAPLDDTDIDYDDFLDHPLPPDALRCLRYMHDVEHHTTCYLRDLLVTSAHDDPEITSFLAMWAFEEFWHGEAIGKVLDRHHESHGRDRMVQTRRRVGRQRAKTLFTMAASSMTEHFEAVALTWGAVNEWTTQAAYVRLACSGRSSSALRAAPPDREAGRTTHRLLREPGGTPSRPPRRAALGAHFPAPILAAGRLGGHAEGGDRLSGGLSVR